MKMSIHAKKLVFSTALVPPCIRLCFGNFKPSVLNLLSHMAEKLRNKNSTILSVAPHIADTQINIAIHKVTIRQDNQLLHLRTKGH